VEALSGAREAATKAAEKAEAARVLRDAALTGLGLPAAGEATGAGIAAAVDADALRRSEAEESLRQVNARLLADDRTREDRRVAVEEREKAEREGRVWLALRDLIGEAQGGKFRKFAQGLTLEALVKSANQHLEEFARRYRLMQAPGTEVGLLVVDCDMGDEVRSVESLSGGESFLVSLALALGLASLATRRAAIGSLFIDEGFGSLDADTLDRAVAALDVIRASGRRIGVISHVQGLAEKIGVQVKVVARGGGRSEVRVVGA
jgi:exonuclease SbcC